MKWISVKDKLPPYEVFGIYLVYFNERNISNNPYEVAFFFEGKWELLQNKQIFLISPTHWMPLPEPPKE